MTVFDDEDYAGDYRPRYDQVETFLNQLDREAWCRTEILDDDNEPIGLYAIDHTKLMKLTFALQAFIAEVVATILNAGSERDAVNENAALADAIDAELRSWSDDPNMTGETK